MHLSPKPSLGPAYMARTVINFRFNFQTVTKPNAIWQRVSLAPTFEIKSAKKLKVVLKQPSLSPAQKAALQLSAYLCGIAEIKYFGK